MNIIKRGKKPEELYAMFECRNCGSELEAQKREGQLVSDQRDGDFYKFACPVCSKEINVSETQFANKLSKKQATDMYWDK